MCRLAKPSVGDIRLRRNVSRSNSAPDVSPRPVEKPTSTGRRKPAGAAETYYGGNGDRQNEVLGNPASPTYRDAFRKVGFPGSATPPYKGEADLDGDD